MPILAVPSSPINFPPLRPRNAEPPPYAKLIETQACKHDLPLLRCGYRGRVCRPGGGRDCREHRLPSRRGVHPYVRRGAFRSRTKIAATIPAGRSQRVHDGGSESAVYAIISTLISIGGRDEQQVVFKFASYLSTMTGRPATFVMAVALVIVWAVTGPFFHYSDTWQLVINTSTTIVTFLMVFLIQNTQNRDTAAMQIKLDELIRAMEGAHNALLDLEELEEKDLSRFRKHYEKLAEEARTALRAGGSDTDSPSSATMTMTTTKQATRIAMPSGAPHATRPADESIRRRGASAKRQRHGELDLGGNQVNGGGELAIAAVKNLKSAKR